MEQVSKVFPRRGELPALYELETSLCPCVTGSYADNLLGGYLLDNQCVKNEELKGDSVSGFK